MPNDPLDLLGPHQGHNQWAGARGQLSCPHPDTKNRKGGKNGKGKREERKRKGEEKKEGKRKAKENKGKKKRKERKGKNCMKKNMK